MNSWPWKPSCISSPEKCRICLLRLISHFLSIGEQWEFTILTTRDLTATEQQMVMSTKSASSSLALITWCLLQYPLWSIVVSFECLSLCELGWLMTMLRLHWANPLCQVVSVMSSKRGIGALHGTVYFDCILVAYSVSHSTPWNQCRRKCPLSLGIEPYILSCVTI